MRLIYVSHPEVVMDPAVLVPDWPLSEEGRHRTEAIAANGWPGPGWQFVSSPERKARETAEILAGGQEVRVSETTGEVDRSSTGYLPHAEHEEQANALFANPEVSTRGWERGVDAQARMVAALDALSQQGRDTVMVGHGAVGTFLFCHLAGRPIARAEDQPRGGCVWRAELGPSGWQIGHGWLPFEAL